MQTASLRYAKEWTRKNNTSNNNGSKAASETQSVTRFMINIPTSNPTVVIRFTILYDFQQPSVKGELNTDQTILNADSIPCQVAEMKSWKKEGYAKIKQSLASFSNRKYPPKIPTIINKYLTTLTASRGSTPKRCTGKDASMGTNEPPRSCPQ